MIGWVGQLLCSGDYVGSTVRCCWLVVCLLSTRRPPGPSLKSSCPASQPPACIGAGIIPPLIQEFTFHLVELLEVPVNPFVQPAEVPLDGSTTLWCISHFSQFCIISELAEGMLCPIIQIVNEDVKQCWCRYWLWGYTTNNWPPAGLCATGHHPLDHFYSLCFLSENFVITRVFFYFQLLKCAVAIPQSKAYIFQLD